MRALLLAVILVTLTGCSGLPSTPPVQPPTFSESPTVAQQSPESAPTVDTPTRAASHPPVKAAPPPPTTAVPAGCRTGWGTGVKTKAEMGSAAITAIRVGRHACYDRVTFDIAGPVAGYTVGYVDTVTADASGNPVDVPGAARLQVVIRHPSDLTAAPGTSLANVAGFTTLRSVIAAGSFEGISTLGVGVAGKRPFRVLIFKDPNRFALDVAHR